MVLERMTNEYPVHGLLMYLDGKVTMHYSNPTRSISGFDLAQSISAAMAARQRLDECIQKMSEVLESGETFEERKTRIQYENDNPEKVARSNGWTTTGDFHHELMNIARVKASCGGTRDPLATGTFANRLNGVPANKIIKPAQNIEWYTTGWSTYPARGEFWADHFQHADTWTDALNICRKEKQ